MPVAWSLGGEYWLVLNVMGSLFLALLPTPSLKVSLLLPTWCLCWVVLDKLVTMSSPGAPSVLCCHFRISLCVLSDDFPELHALCWGWLLALGRQHSRPCTTTHSLLVPKYSLNSLSAWVNLPSSFFLRYVLFFFFYSPNFIWTMCLIWNVHQLSSLSSSHISRLNSCFWLRFFFSRMSKTAVECLFSVVNITT